MNRRNFLKSGLAVGLFAALHTDRVLPAIRQRSGTIKILGIGGAGVHVLNMLVEEPAKRVAYGCIETSGESLARSKTSHKYLLGPVSVDGIWGAPRMAIIRDMAWRRRTFLGEALAGADCVLLIGGLSGGTGGGIMPVVAEIALANGIIPRIIGILPFAFEGSERRRLAGINATLLQAMRGTDFMMINNQSVLQRLPPNPSLLMACQSSDRVVATVAKKQLRAVGGLPVNVQ